MKKSKNILKNKYRKEKEDAFCLISQKKPQRTLIRLAVGQGLSRWRKRRSAHTGGVLRPQWLTGWRTGNLRCWRRSLRQLLTENGQSNFFLVRKIPFYERERKNKKEKKSQSMHVRTQIFDRDHHQTGAANWRSASGTARGLVDSTRRSDCRTRRDCWRRGCCWTAGPAVTHHSPSPSAHL